VNVLRMGLAGEDTDDFFAVVAVHNSDHHNAELVEALDPVEIGRASCRERVLLAG
jgi:hypothetical protein